VQKQSSAFLKILLMLTTVVLLVSMAIAIAPTFEEGSRYDKLLIVFELVFLVLIAMVIFSLIERSRLPGKRKEGEQTDKT
jgi:uncharacterized membrane protein (DUF373 family)